MNQLEKLQNFIGKISYFNAAEPPQYYSQGETKMRLKVCEEIREEIESWKLKREEFVTLYAECDRGLTSITDFTSDYMVGVTFEK